MLANKWLALLALPLLATFAIACGGSSGGSDQGIRIEQTDNSGGGNGGPIPTPGGAVPTLAAAPTPSGSPVSVDEVASLSTNFGKVKSFKATLSQTGGLQGAIEYSAPDKIHVVIGSGATGQEIICIGEVGYYKTGSNAWQKQPANAPPCRGNLGPADPAILTEGIKTAAQDKTLNKGAQDTVGGKKCQIYSQSLPNGLSFEMCIADGLPLRIVSKDPQKTLTILFSDFDKPIDIKAPL
jgi:hypothetical protein